jgi:hypothetical protein
MAENKFTPGPWTIDNCQGIDHMITISANGKWIASVEHNDPIKPTDEDNANARLIISAPDLLQAAENLLASLDDTGESQDDEGNDYHDIAPLRAAIRKAKGE